MLRRKKVSKPKVAALATGKTLRWILTRGLIGSAITGTGAVALIQWEKRNKSWQGLRWSEDDQNLAGTVAVIGAAGAVGTEAALKVGSRLRSR